MNYYDYQTTVNYSDLGEDGLLSPSGALRLMQEAACMDSAAVGCAPKDLMKNHGVGWVLVGWKIHFSSRPEWGVPLSVKTWPRRIAGHLSDRDFTITDGSGTPVLAATSRWLLLDLSTGHVGQVSEALAAAYTIWDHKAVEGEIPTTGRSPADAVETFTYTALRRDLDTFHHVNNLHYLELAREAMPEDVAQICFPNVEILYKRQIKRGDTVHFFYSCQEGRHLVELKDSTLKKTHALLWFY